MLEIMQYMRLRDMILMLMMFKMKEFKINGGSENHTDVRSNSQIQTAVCMFAQADKVDHSCALGSLPTAALTFAIPEKSNSQTILVRLNPECGLQFLCTFPFQIRSFSSAEHRGFPTPCIRPPTPPALLYQTSRFPPPLSPGQKIYPRAAPSACPHVLTFSRAG